MSNPVIELRKYLADKKQFYDAIKKRGAEIAAYYNEIMYAQGLLTKPNGEYRGTYLHGVYTSPWYVPDFNDGACIWEDEKRGVGVIAVGKDERGATCDSCFIPCDLFEEDYAQKVEKLVHDILVERNEARAQAEQAEKERLAGRMRIFRGELST